MKRLGVILLATVGLASLAHAADVLPTVKPAPPSKPNCFGSFWSWLNSSAEDCPLTYAGVTAYATIDIGYGFQTNGAPFNPNADKLAYGIQKYSNGRRWAPSYNGLSASVVGLKMKEDLGYGWSVIGLVEAGVNPYSGMLLNPPQSLTDNNVNTLANQSANFDSSRNGAWNNSQAFLGISNQTFGTLAGGRMNSLSFDTQSKYDPLGGSAAFSLIGFSNSFPGFGDTETVRPNTAFAYRLSYANFRVAALAQVGGYDLGNGSNGLYQGQLGGDFGNLSLDGIVSWAKDAVSLANFAGSNLAQLDHTGQYFIKLNNVYYDPNTILKATLSNNAAVELMAKYKWDKLTLYGGYIYARLGNPSDAYAGGFPTISQGIFVPPGQVTSSNYNVNKILNTFWTGARYSIFDNLDLATGLYYQMQNDFNFTVNKQGHTIGAACTGISTGVSSNKCAGSQGAVSFLADWKPYKRVDVYAGVMISNVWGGLANGFLHTQNIDPTVGIRVRF